MTFPSVDTSHKWTLSRGPSYTQTQHLWTSHQRIPLKSGHSVEDPATHKQCIYELPISGYLSKADTQSRIQPHTNNAFMNFPSVDTSHKWTLSRGPSYTQTQHLWTSHQRIPLKSGHSVEDPATHKQCIYELPISGYLSQADTQSRIQPHTNTTFMNLPSADTTQKRTRRQGASHINSHKWTPLQSRQ